MKKNIFTLFIAIITTNLTFATGPSYIDSRINPIAINNNGDVLCKTIYEENQMGGYGYMDRYYGLCILTEDSIIEYPVFKLDGEYYESVINRAQDIYCDLYGEWNKWYNNQTTNITQEETTLIDKYNFTDCKISQYYKADTLSLDEFKLKYNIDITYRTLNTLHGGKSFSGDKYYREGADEYVEKVIVSYVFNDKMILQSKCFDAIYIGLNYDFKTNFFGGIPYEYFNIDGILFKNKE